MKGPATFFFVIYGMLCAAKVKERRASSVDTLPKFANCVLHAGDSRETLSGEDTEQASGSCSFNAECIRERGKNSASDGLVDLACAGTHCTCTLQPLWPRSAPKKVPGEIEAPCTTTERAKALLVERCLGSMQIVDGAANEPTEANEVVRYFSGAELQVETKQQRLEIKRALEDLLRLSPAALEKRRYADYVGQANRWRLGQLLMKYYVSSHGPDGFTSEARLYEDAQAQAAKEVIRRLITQLRG